MQIDNNQLLMEKEGERFGIPVIYFTELLGLALGHTAESLGMTSHRVDVEPFLKKWAASRARAQAPGIEEGINQPGALG